MYGTGSATEKLAGWFANSPESPLCATPSGTDPDAWFDLKIISQPGHTAVDIFEQRGLDRGGAVVVIRPDQYVANVLPLTATAELGEFFAALLKPSQAVAAAAR